MSDIVFKAKTTVKEVGEFNNVWVEGDLITSNGKHYIHPKNNAVSVSGELGKIIVMHEVDPETISQYIGLCDKNGRRIFEGDIVTVKFKEYVGKIVYKDCGFEVRWTDSSIRKDIIFFKEKRGIEVIGNIFDNPELLEGGN